MILNANALHIPLADGCVQTVMTSPPYYGLRDYGIDGQLGLERTPDEYVANLVAVFREVWRVLRDDGTLWLNIGDSYNGSGKGGVFSTANAKQATNKGANIGLPTRIPNLKPKDLLMIPSRLALALQQPFLRCKNCDAVAHRSKWGHYPNGRLICPNCEKSKGYTVEQPGWYVRSDIIWSKANPMPESVTDRPTRSHEYVFLLTKSARYYYDAQAILEPAAYDGRKDKKYKGGPKDVSIGEHDRWPNSIDTKYTEDDAADMGGAGTNWVGHSAYHGADGRELFHRNAEGIPARNKRSVWTINTQPVKYSHFATFPEKLVEPCILAGTSEKGCCPKCGKAWERVVEKPIPPKEVFTKTRKPKDGYVGGFNKDGEFVGTGQKLQNWLNEHPAKTLGWQPACSCGAGDPVPCLVFDPFAGSGTVERVAIRLGRRTVGCELNYKYIAEIASRRTTDIQVRLI